MKFKIVVWCLWRRCHLTEKESIVLFLSHWLLISFRSVLSVVFSVLIFCVHQFFGVFLLLVLFFIVIDQLLFFSSVLAVISAVILRFEPGKVRKDPVADSASWGRWFGKIRPRFSLQMPWIVTHPFLMQTAYYLTSPLVDDGGFHLTRIVQRSYNQQRSTRKILIRATGDHLGFIAHTILQDCVTDPLDTGCVESHVSNHVTIATIKWSIPREMNRSRMLSFTFEIRGYCWRVLNTQIRLTGPTRGLPTRPAQKRNPNNLYI